MEIKRIIENSQEFIGKEVEVKGWIRFNRPSKNIGFIELFDGTKLNGIQLVYKPEINDFEELSNLPLFSALAVKGEVVEGRDSVELKVKEITHSHKVEKELIIGKNELNFETLRDNAHLRPRTKYFQSVLKIRSIAAQAIHEFFIKEQYHYVHAPIITGNDAEGAGEAFLVKDQRGETFFSNQGTLSVSGQLHAEGFAQAFTKTYTFGPTFRAENSNTTRHAAEFWMIEPEVAYADYFEIMGMGEELVKFCVKRILETSKDELEFLGEYHDTDQIAFLENLIKEDFNKIEYREAIEILNKAIAEGQSFENNNIEFGTDLDTDHERYISEVYSKGTPTYVYNYPTKIKSFYMYQNDDETCRGFDLLVPKIGELIGGSQREESFEKLEKTISLKGLDLSELEWYTDLRKQGYSPSTGFGLGFERLVMLLSGTENIRDVLPFPRTPGQLKF